MVLYGSQVEERICEALRGFRALRPAAMPEVYVGAMKVAGQGREAPVLLPPSLIDPAASNPATLINDNIVPSTPPVGLRPRHAVVTHPLPPFSPQLAFSPVVAAVEFAGAAGESEEGPLLSPALHSFSLLGKKLAGMYAGGWRWGGMKGSVKVWVSSGLSFNFDSAVM